MTLFIYPLYTLLPTYFWWKYWSEYTNQFSKKENYWSNLIDNIIKHRIKMSIHLRAQLTLLLNYKNNCWKHVSAIIFKNWKVQTSRYAKLSQLSFWIGRRTMDMIWNSLGLLKFKEGKEINLVYIQMLYILWHKWEQT